MSQGLIKTSGKLEIRLRLSASSEGGHIAAELRLWDALERGRLCPFQYFGLHDNADLSGVTWSRKGYDIAELEHLYTGDDARVRLVLKQLEEKHRNVHKMRALGFCVSIAHAEFMAKRFSEAGLPSQAVSADSDSDTRRTALSDLRAGRLRALFAVNLFNEGVDLPEIDTLLFLRPTESALIFMQQLGRGLRRSDTKDCVTVLDFIGQAHRKFRFDLRYRAVTGGTRSEVEKQIQQGFPFLPAGCSMQLDKVASRIVLDNLATAIPTARPAMVRELRALAESEHFSGRAPLLAEFLAESGLELVDVYKSGSWTSLKRAAGLPQATAGPNEDEIGDAFRRILYIDDRLRLDAYRKWLASTADGLLNDAGTRIVNGLLATIWGRKMPASISDAHAMLNAHPALLEELDELFNLLEAQSTHLTFPLSSGIPLSVHARHSLVDVFAAMGRITPGDFYQHREGVYFAQATNTDLFFVTLEKADRDYSPTTLYKDYAISPTLFHWESQSMTSTNSPTGHRYINQQPGRSEKLLFVRQKKKQDGVTMPYTLLGPVDYVSHQQERPIQLVWRLRQPMPADFFRQAKVAAG